MDPIYQNRIHCQYTETSNRFHLNRRMKGNGAESTKSKPDGMRDAILENDISAVRHMLDEGRDPDGMIGAFTPLILAVTEGRTGIVDMLLERGAKPSGRAAASRMSPLHAAAISTEKPECVEIAKSLLLHESNPNAIDCRGFRPLDFLIGNGQRVRRMRRLLASRGGRKGDGKAIERAHLMEGKTDPGSVRYKSLGEFCQETAKMFAEAMNGILVSEIIDEKDDRLEDLDGRPIVFPDMTGGRTAICGLRRLDPSDKVVIVEYFDMIARTLIQYGTRDPMGNELDPGRGLTVSEADMARVKSALSSIAREFVYKKGENYNMFGRRAAMDHIVGFEIKR